MAVYKVIQDVEAEDKLVGPLTFRQFVYALVAAGLGYLSYFLIAHHAGFLATPFVPVAMISAFFAFPWGRDQPTEVWALAKIRYFFKPRRRIWDQSGAKELVTVTAPKRLNINYTNGLSQNEVKSRLKVLADTLDSRGWVVRNADPNSPNQITQAIANTSSDRLVAATPAPVPMADADVRASDDIMDPQNNPIARQFDNMINASAQAHRQQIIDTLQQAIPSPTPSSQDSAAANNRAGSHANGGGKWFLGQPLQPSVSASQNAVTFNAQVVTPGAPEASLPVTPATPTADEEALIKELEKENAPPINTYTHLHTIQPLSVQQQQAKAQAEATLLRQQKIAAEQAAMLAQQQVTQPQDAGILDLASNNDLNVATIAREAQKRRPQDEVVISLH
jgi:hypothetical protein